VEELTLEVAKGYDCVIVDEAQFLTRPQVELLTTIVDELNMIRSISLADLIQ
jgi:thymidine kinase